MSRSAKTAQRLEQRAGLVGQREDDGRLVHERIGIGYAAHDEEPRDVVGEVLDFGLQNLEAEHLRRALRRDGCRAHELLFLDQLCAAGRVVGGLDRHVRQARAGSARTARAPAGCE